MSILDTPRMTTTEILTHSRRALNDLESLTHLYPQLRILIINVEDRGPVSVLIAQDTFDEFIKFLDDAYYEPMNIRSTFKYRSIGRYRSIELTSHSNVAPTTYKYQEVADNV